MTWGDEIEEQTNRLTDALFDLLFRVQDDHEPGDWNQDLVFCKKCGPPTEYPCEYRRWVEASEGAMPPAILKRWRRRLRERVGMVPT